MAGEAELVARAAHARAEDMHDRAVAGGGVEAAVLMILAREFHAFAAALRCQPGPAPEGVRLGGRRHRPPAGH